MTALYATIWIALVLFVTGESGRALTPSGRKPPAWAWWAFFSGWVLSIVHTVIAFDVVHHWDHADAVRSTAMQTAEVFGAGFGGGVYVNYVFFAVWLADACWWRVAPAAVRPRAATWLLRAFYLLILVNAAIVFVPGTRRVAGLLLVAWLGRIWWPGFSARAPSSPPRR